MIRLAAIAALMATPALADFKPVTLTAYCSADFTEVEGVFGQFESVDFSKPNSIGVSSAFMENERYTLTGVSSKGVVCITWVLDRGELG